LEPHRAFIKERISQTPHLTLHGLKDELAARGIAVSHNAVWLFLRREGLRFKKTYGPPRCKWFLRVRHDRSASTYPASDQAPAKMEIRASRSS
jgi:putative transposase